MNWDAFGAMVSTKRSAERRTLRELGAYLDIPASTLSRIENGLPTEVESFLVISAWLGKPHEMPSICKHCKGTGVERKEGTGE